ncbi:MAG: OmpA family protein [Prevotellaceae bacterium]|nr:OmpA family protein [Prevotellaceae bacterium]
MKSKLVILSLLLTGFAVTASGQTKDKYYSESAKDNWFISLGVGAQALMNESNTDYGIGKAITPAIGVSVGRWINPNWGFRGQVAAWESKLWTDPFGDSKWTELSKTSFRLHADAIYNLSNAIAGYNPDRIFTLSAFAGPGLIFAKDMIKPDGGLNTVVSGSLGLMGGFNLNQYWDLNLEVRGTVSPSVFVSESRAVTDGILTGLVGVSYTFGGKKFAPAGCKVDVDALNAEINKYRQALADAEAEMARLRAAANKPAQVREVTKEVQVAGPRAIFFTIGKSVIDDYGKANIKFAAQIMKANTDKKYKVVGYGDAGTGSAKYNQTLSEKRAKNVYDALIEAGVSSSQIEYVGGGAKSNDNILDKARLNRVVIIE